MSDKKRLFEALDEMNQKDITDGTALVKVSGHFVRSNQVKAGTEITMGIENSTMREIESGESLAIVVVVNKKEYEKLTQ